jgi:anti-sigma factor RsiW
MMATCERIQTQLATYALGGGGRRRRARLERHLAHCAGCRRELAALTRTGHLLSALPLTSAPAGTWEAVLALLTQQPARVLRRAPLSLWRPRWRLALATVVLLVIGVGLLSLSPRARPTPQPERSVVQVDADMQASVDGHLLAAHVSPLSDDAAIGLDLEAEEGPS